MLDTLLNIYPIYKKITSFLSQHSLKNLNLTSVYIYKILNRFGFMKTLYFMNASSLSLISNHLTTLRHITFYKVDNILNKIPPLNKHIQLRVHYSTNFISNERVNLSIYNLILLGKYTLFKSKDLNKLQNLIKLGLEIHDDKEDIFLPNLEEFKVYGTINLNKFHLPKLDVIFYYVNTHNLAEVLDFKKFKTVKKVIVFMTIYTQLKKIIVPKSIEHMRIFINDTMYEKIWKGDKIIHTTLFHRRIRNITEMEDYYIIYPVRSAFDNYYYY
jgi:hypothetical protein